MPDARPVCIGWSHERCIDEMVSALRHGHAWTSVLIPDGFGGERGATLEEAEEALSRTVTELREAYQALAIGRDSESDENARLRAALVEAREAIAAVHHAGFDSTRQQLATAGVRGITAALGQERSQ